MPLDADTVAALAPDAPALAAGRKLAVPGPWSGLGRSDAAVWGVCRGSANYEVRADLSDLAAKCSCPSRKFPCKHALGLLLLAATQPAAVPEGAAPAWVSDWLAKRSETAAKREAKAAAPPKPVDPEAQAKRAERRESRVAAGLDALDLWMQDRVRAGLATFDGAGPTPWYEQAARLVDAQAPALAGHVRRLAEIPGSGADWPERLLGEMGRVALLAEAWRRIDALDPPLREDVRQRIGFPPDLAAAAETGRRAADRWAVAAQAVDDEDRVRVQRNWLRGERTGGTALVLQFAPGRQPFPEPWAAGTCFDAELAFVPGAAGWRAVVRGQRDATSPWAGPLRGHASVGAFLDEAAATLARSPWTDVHPCALSGVVPADATAALVVDSSGEALPVRTAEPWTLVALSGGAPVDVFGEWDGRSLRVLSVIADGRFRALGGPA